MDKYVIRYMVCVSNNVFKCSSSKNEDGRFQLHLVKDSKKEGPDILEIVTVSSNCFEISSIFAIIFLHLLIKLFELISYGNPPYALVKRRPIR